jgi:glycosyltransferase involved in cell wall biosynthesis
MTGFMPLDAVEAEFDGASVLVNTTDFEGFPNTFLQAWSRGMPTLSFFDAGARLNGREVGCSVAVLDAMAIKLRELKSSPTRWAEESERVAAYHADRHTVAAAVDGYEQLFEALTTGRPVFEPATVPGAHMLGGPHRGPARL